MKLFDARMAPNSRRVRIFLAEKGLEVETVPVAITEGEQYRAEFLAINPMGKVPVLETDEGFHIAESEAICFYVEQLHPDPPLFGTTPQERAEALMWDRRVELELFIHILGTFQHTSPFFADRVRQVPEYAESARRRAWQFITWLDSHLADNEYLAGDRFTVADITLFCALDFARVIGEGVHKDDIGHVKGWHHRMKSRPSAEA